MLFINLDRFGVPNFGDIGRRDFCLLFNIMGLNGALNVEQFHFLTYIKLLTTRSVDSFV